MDIKRQENNGLEPSGIAILMAEKPDRQPERRARYLTDHDIERLAEVFEERISKRLYIGVGKGVLKLFWRVVIIVIIAIAAYGMGKGFKF